MDPAHIPGRGVARPHQNCSRQGRRGQTYFLVRTITAEISAISTAPSKNSAAVSWERCSSLSPTFSTFPPTFSPDFIRSSTFCPTFFSRMLRMVSLGCKSILPWAKRLQQAKPKRQAMRRDERFMVVLFCPRTRRIASENDGAAQDVDLHIGGERLLPTSIAGRLCQTPARSLAFHRRSEEHTSELQSL